MTVLYGMDPERSSFTAQAFTEGLLSFLAQSPTFALRRFGGEVRWEPEGPGAVGLEVTVRADSLELVDGVQSADRAEIEGRMRREMLQAGAHPEIRLEATEITTLPVSHNQHRLQVVALLSLNGVTRRQSFEADLLVHEEGVRLGSAFSLRLSAYRIRPVSALGGSIQMRDQLRVALDIIAWREPA